VKGVKGEIPTFYSQTTKQPSPKNTVFLKKNTVFLKKMAVFIKNDSAFLKNVGAFEAKRRGV